MLSGVITALASRGGQVLEREGARLTGLQQTAPANGLAAGFAGRKNMPGARRVSGSWSRAELSASLQASMFYFYQRMTDLTFGCHSQ